MLTEPPVLLALLEYLGPACDQGLLTAGGAQADHEERRMRLREEMFGTPWNVDLTKGKTKPTEEHKALWEKLNRGSEGEKEFGEVDPLSLLYIALGWMDFPTLYGQYLRRASLRRASRAARLTLTATTAVAPRPVPRAAASACPRWPPGCW